MDFNYIVQRQEKAKICFGSGLERKLLDFDKNGLVSKHARSNMREIHDVGPGSYDISMQTSALSRVLNKPTSKLGTVLGGRKAERKAVFASDMSIPGPKYNISKMSPKKQFRAPFNSKAERTNYKIPNRSGMEIHKTASYKRRRMIFDHSFGGIYMLPAIKMKCELFNFVKCGLCKKFPKKYYWCLNAVDMTKKPDEKKTKTTSQALFLCQICYDLEKKKKNIFFRTNAKFIGLQEGSKVYFPDRYKANRSRFFPKKLQK